MFFGICHCEEQREKQSQPEIATRSTQVISCASLAMTDNIINRQLSTDFSYLKTINKELLTNVETRRAVSTLSPRQRRGATND